MNRDAEKVKILICGLGSIGRRHLKLLRKYPDVHVSAYRTGKGALVDSIEGVDEYSSLSSALNSQPDAAIISNPTALHISTALKIAQAGVPIFIEKPVSNNLDNIEELKRLCNEQQISVLIGGYLPYHPAVALIEDLLQSQRLGHPIYMRSQFGSYLPNWHPWEDYRESYSSRRDLGGGVVLTSIHEISFALALFGPVMNIQASEIPLGTLKMDVEQGVEIILSHQTKVVSSIHLNYFQKPNNRYCEIICSDGTIFWDFWKPEVVVKMAAEQEIIDLEKTPEDLIHQCYQEQTDHFLKVLSGSAQPKISLEKGIEDLKTALAILKKIKRF